MAAEFRPDINGLRAWAVVAVVLYHFGIPGFGGGFIGVDVFFVISGFLMTGIVIKSLERQTFSIWAFYVARARRIAPALLVLCSILLLLGWWLLLPSDYLRLATHAIGSLSFLSNVVYWKEAGYFDVNSHDKWLLHTWSLSVEWQFYILLPIALASWWRWKPGRGAATWALAAAFVASLALCVIITPGKPSTAFYLLPTRAWEMLAGGLVLFSGAKFTMKPGQAKTVEVIGMGLILFSATFFNAGTPWPGWRAAVPVLGCAMVLYAARPASGWTNNSLAQWLGTRSYSIYLWHWPLVVALRYASLSNDPVAVTAAIALTMVLGHFSYRWVEIPARRRLESRSLLSNFSVLIGVAAAVALGGSLVILKVGISGRFAPDIELTSAAALDRNARTDTCHTDVEHISSPSCVYGSGPLRAIVLGDSHANAVVSAVAAAVPSTSPGSVMQWSYSACPTIQGANRMAGEAQSKCPAFVDWALKELKNIPPTVPVVVVNRHAQYVFGKLMEGPVDVPWVYFSQVYPKVTPALLKEYAEHLTATACALTEFHPVYLVRPIPEMKVNVPGTARAMLFGRSGGAAISLSEYHRRNDLIIAAQDAARDQCGVKILDPLPYLCWDSECHGTKDGRPLYFDDNHLSETGNKVLVPMFGKIFDR